MLAASASKLQLLRKSAGSQHDRGRTTVIRKCSLILLIVALAAAQDRPIFRVKVDMVVLSFTVTDNKNKYINNLKPTDFRISEDGIVQKIATFAKC